MNLQQQKLLELTSHLSKNLASKIIYNSRNYQSLLAERQCKHTYKTIYNSRNYQSLLASKRFIITLTYLQQQKLLELTSQFFGTAKVRNLQQQKLLELTSPLAKFIFTHNLIYNSRNYQSLLARVQRGHKGSLSTIVEIIRAYQPKLLTHSFLIDLQQQKLLELTSPLSIAKIQKIL